MNISRLVGYVRKANDNKVINFTVDKATINDCDSYKTQDGRDMVRLDVNLDKMRELINGQREVTSVIQIEGGE